MDERLLLNVLLSLTPVFAYHIMTVTNTFRRDSRYAAWFMGLLSGFAAVLCMCFPIASGKDFVWDFRWIPYLIAVVYGGTPGGLICGGIMLLCRAYLGGLLSWCTVALDCVVLFLAMMRYRRMMKRFRLSTVIWSSVIISTATYVFVITTIFLDFVINGQATLFLHHGVTFFLSYGFVTVAAHSLAVLLIENLFTQHQLRRKIADMDKLSLLGRMAASIAHEIRNPLTVAKGFMQLSIESEPEQIERYLRLSIAELNRTETIISDYLNYAEPQVERTEEMSVRQACEEVIEHLLPLAVLRKVQIHSTLAHDLFIRCSTLKFKQVVMNLVENAVEAIPSHGGQVRIRTEVMRSGVGIVIEDTGIGMTPKQLEQLGTPFYSTKAKGTGLGLMVTFRLAQAMGGKLSFDSHPGKGTTARFEVPFAVEG